MAKVHEIVSKILGYSELGRGWDSYDAPPPTIEEIHLACDIARRIADDVRLIDVAPILDGGIELLVAQDDERLTIRIERNADG